MMMLGFLLAIAAAADSSRLSFQLMSTPAYESFGRKADAMCPERKLRYLHPGDLGGIEEDFLLPLSKREQHRVAVADLGFRGCPIAGMSCPAQHTLSAIIRAGMLDDFVKSACSSAK